MNHASVRPVERVLSKVRFCVTVNDSSERRLFGIIYSGVLRRIRNFNTFKATLLREYLCIYFVSNGFMWYRVHVFAFVIRVFFHDHRYKRTFGRAPHSRLSLACHCIYYILAYMQCLRMLLQIFVNKITLCRVRVLVR